MLKHAIRRALAAATALALGAGIAVGTAAAANAVDTSSQCVVDVIHHDAVTELSHQEYQYKQDIPEKTETFHDEYRYSRTATIYTVEHKQVQYTDNASNVLNWLNANGTEGPTDVWTINDSVVNGAGVNPFAPGIFYDGPFTNVHRVNLNNYGGPNVQVPYTITGIEWGLTVPPTPFYTSHSVTLYYTGSGDGSPQVADAIYVPGAAAPDAPWSLFGSPQSVSNNDAAPASTIYYLTGGTSSTTLTDANWTTLTPGIPWVKIHERTVIDRAAVAAYDENVYGDCPATPCTSTSDSWFTEAENVLPTFEPNGLKFAGPNVKAVRYLHAVSGNLMGVIGSSYTIADASGYHAALNYIINPHTSITYATIVIEPYVNGWAPGQTGTFTVTSTTKVWTNKIANPGLGSQSNPATIAQMSAIFPANTLLAQGLHLGSNSVAGQYTVVSGITGCGSFKWVSPPTVSCFANSDELGENLVLPATTGVLWKVNGGAAQAGPVSVPLTSSDVTIEAAPAAGYTFGPGTTTWKFEADDSGICQVPTLAQFPTNVTHTDQVCASGKVAPGTITVGMVNGTSFFTGQVDYFLDGSATPMTQQTVAVAPGKHTVTAAPHDPNDTLEGLTSWEITVAAATAACGDLTTLALTGTSSPAPWMLLGELLVVAGLSAMAVQSVRRRQGLI